MIELPSPFCIKTKENCKNKMEYSIDNILKDVRVILGENEDIGNLLEDSGINDDQLATERDTLLTSLVCKAIDRVHLTAPLEMVSDASVDMNPLPSVVGTNMFVTLPKEFLRLYAVKMKSWDVPVSTAIGIDDDEYLKYHSRFGVKPSAKHPSVAIVPSKNGLSLEPYPSESTVYDYAKIIKMASVASNKVGIAKACYDAVLYMIANLYYVSIDETQKAKAMANEVAEILGLNTQAEQ